MSPIVPFPPAPAVLGLLVELGLELADRFYTHPATLSALVFVDVAVAAWWLG